MRRKKNFTIENIVFTGIADGGKAVGRHDGKVVFAEGAVPGDTANILVTKSKGGYYEGRVETLITPSVYRVAAVCNHFGVCGGCKWQHLAYTEQLRQKEQTVIDAITRIGKVEVGEWLPIVGSAATTYYRNKLEYSFSAKRWITEEEAQTDEKITEQAVGFHKAGFFEKVVAIEHCHLQHEPTNALRNAVRDYTLANDYTYYHAREHTGWMRNMMVRTASTGEVMVLVSFDGSCPEEKRTNLLDFIRAEFPSITALVYVINPKHNDTIYDLTVHLHSGREFIYEKLGNTTYKISPKSFFQTNTSQALRLYEITAEMAALTGSENVYDLYTGTGSIACFIAKTAKQVVGIEEVGMAVEDAWENARLNDLANVKFYTGDVKNILTADFSATHGRPDVVITDPPRAGMHGDVITTLLALAAPRIVYVSCNPATQARDIALLSEKYAVLKVQPVDMFPHTHHIESVALLELKD